MRQVGEALAVTWRPIHERRTTVTDETGAKHDIVCRCTFSASAPFAIEMWQAIPGTPLAIPDTGILHHVGYWVEDLPQEVKRLEAAGFGSFMIGPHLAIHQRPGALLLSSCEL